MERHRHRYEVNPVYVEQLGQSGLDFVGKDETGQRCEIIELRSHPYYVGVQYHPEYMSRVLAPSKPYFGLVAASAGSFNKALDYSSGARPRNSLKTAAVVTNGVPSVMSLRNGLNGGGHG